MRGDRGESDSHDEVSSRLQGTPPSSPEGSVLPSSSVSPGGCGSAIRSAQWEAYAHRLRGSPSPSSSSRSSATTADTFLLEDVSFSCGFYLIGDLVRRTDLAPLLVQIYIL
jgi:hypothetical protein